VPTSITHTRFTEAFSLAAPIAQAPMVYAAGGALAAACARAGALGLVGGGYGELPWLAREYELALSLGPRERIGCGFITWKLDEDASALDWVLQHRPRAVMLSFGDPRPYGRRIADAGAALVRQVQRMDQVPLAIEAGATIVVAQGGEAGGHGMDAHHGRAVISFVPEAADWLAARSPATLLLAAGGIADGRGLAAVRMLGADGVLVGSRFWATQECLSPDAAKRHALAQDGDATARSPVFDILRRKAWPAPYDFRAVRNDLHRQWEQDIESLRASPDEARAVFDAAVAKADFRAANVTVGEALGLMHDLPPAADVVTRMVREAEAALARFEPARPARP
jgi:nitronate monooxygenase